MYWLQENHLNCTLAREIYQIILENSWDSNRLYKLLVGLCTNGISWLDDWNTKQKLKRKKHTFQIRRQKDSLLLILNSFRWFS